MTSGPTATSTTAISMLLPVVERQAGRPHLLAEHIERLVGQRQDVGDLGIADQRLGEGPVGPQHLALVERHRQLAGADLVGLADGDLRRGRRGGANARPRPRWQRRAPPLCP